jgi:hypothetical protein
LADRDANRRFPDATLLLLDADMVKHCAARAPAVLMGFQDARFQRLLLGVPPADADGALAAALVRHMGEAGQEWTAQRVQAVNAFVMGAPAVALSAATLAALLGLLEHAAMPLDAKLAVVGGAHDMMELMAKHGVPLADDAGALAALAARFTRLAAFLPRLGPVAAACATQMAATFECELRRPPPPAGAVAPPVANPRLHPSAKRAKWLPAMVKRLNVELHAHVKRQRGE